jgi:hypothetical protein
MLLRIVMGIFMVLHGLVHLLYVGQSRRLFELQPGMVWPDGAWAFSGLLGEGATRWAASIAYGVAAIGFLVSGVGILARQSWWRPAVVGSAALSALMIVLLWDGKLQKLADQGLIALLINAVILVALLVLKWPGWSI